jgi:hypothetical protein
MDERAYFANTSCTVPGFTRDLGKILSQHALPTAYSCIVLHNCHGVGAKADAFGAFGNRKQHLLVGISAGCSYSDKETRKVAQGFVQNTLEDLKAAKLPLPGKYANFNPREMGDGRMYFGDNLERVREVKQRHDPKNLFAICTPDLS